MAQNRSREGFDILGGDMNPSVEQRSCFTRHDKLLRRARARAPLNMACDPLGRVLVFRSQRSDDIQYELFDMVGERDQFDDPLELKNLFTRNNGCDLTRVRSGGSVDDLGFLISRWVVHDRLK